ncbi:hypothetical protein GUJ93_ZPchr0002g24056 [Zizania palustris]|uniref:Uncharacterized protein n=1 Tax=Zizania palustris TaxID=103762 RepID=A0A8J5RXQ8_ZIZPA|nr:hypothetical protein GUJ93_ZPchr0002g24056 [Zizania palustris]
MMVSWEWYKEEEQYWAITRTYAFWEPLTSDSPDFRGNREVAAMDLTVGVGIAAAASGVGCGGVGVGRGTGGSQPIVTALCNRRSRLEMILFHASWCCGFYGLLVFLAWEL